MILPPAPSAMLDAIVWPVVSSMVMALASVLTRINRSPAVGAAMVAVTAPAATSGTSAGWRDNAAIGDGDRCLRRQVQAGGQGRRAGDPASPAIVASAAVVLPVIVTSPANVAGPVNAAEL